MDAHVSKQHLLPAERLLFLQRGPHFCSCIPAAFISPLLDSLLFFVHLVLSSPVFLSWPPLMFVSLINFWRNFRVNSLSYHYNNHLVNKPLLFSISSSVFPSLCYIFTILSWYVSRCLPSSPALLWKDGWCGDKSEVRRSGRTVLGISALGSLLSITPIWTHWLNIRVTVFSFRLLLLCFSLLGSF